jgi:hypothetical protein
MSLLLVVWGGDSLLESGIITMYQGCGVWVFPALWGMLFELAVSPYNQTDKVAEDVRK